MALIQKMLSFFSKPGTVNPEQAYDLWASGYDNQPGNLMLALDEIIFDQLAGGILLKEKNITDIGCGTGRHWSKLFAANPAGLTGYDVSAGMLQMLKQKFPAATVYKLEDDFLKETGDASVDVLISTLTVAHIKDIGSALTEWNRVVKPGGHILITDYHPEALQRGGRRTFKQDGKTVAIENNIHAIPQMIAYGKQLQWQLLRLEERKIDETVKHFYEKQQAGALYESFKGVSIIYGLLFVKANVDQ